jgi:hypothetical protein
MLPIPATYVLDQDGVLRSASLNPILRSAKNHPTYSTMFANLPDLGLWMSSHPTNDLEGHHRYYRDPENWLRN